MTDNEIIKALECCVTNLDCLQCPYIDYDGDELCFNKLLKDALDLINRQKAEIERLEKVQVQYVKAYFDEFAERLKNDFRLAQLDIGLTSAVVDELVETMNNEFNTLADFTDLIQAEAVKEFAERLKEYVESYDVTTGYKVTIVYAVEEETIDNLVKETVGAESG